MGLEYIVQPQVFLGGLTALGPGIQGLTEQYPLLTTYYSWTSTASVNTSSFPIPIAVGSIYNGPGKEASFIVSVGGVIQSPTEYTVDSILRTITFSSVVSAGIEFAATQLATAAPSSQNFNFLKSVSAEFTALSTINGSFNNLVVTNLTALSTTVNVIDIRISEVSGFRATGNVEVLGNVNVTNNINLTGNLVAAGISSTTLTAVTIGTNSLSARVFNLTHEPPNDGIDPILDIGETATEGFSGIRVRYEENTNRLLVQAVSPTLVINSVIIDRATGQVGISAVPNQALTVAGNISATGAIKSINSWPNRQYRILSADEAPFAANTGTVLWSATPFTIQPNCIYTVSFTAAVSSTSASPAYTLTLSGSAPFTILEGIATGNFTNESGNPYFARDLRELNTGTPTNTYVVVPLRTYTSVGPHFFTISPIISAATTTQIVLSCFSNALSRIKSSSNYAGSLLQTT